MNLLGVDFETDFGGRKTSEGDGVTAADLEAMSPCERGTCAECEQYGKELTDGAE